MRSGPTKSELGEAVLDLEFLAEDLDGAAAKIDGARYVGFVGEIDDGPTTEHDLHRRSATYPDVFAEIEGHVPSEGFPFTFALGCADQHWGKLSLPAADADLDLGMGGQPLDVARRRFRQIGVKNRNIEVELDAMLIGHLGVQEERPPSFAERHPLEGEGHRFMASDAHRAFAALEREALQPNLACRGQPTGDATGGYIRDLHLATFAHRNACSRLVKLLAHFRDL